jgi:hypothetical protein
MAVLPVRCDGPHAQAVRLHDDEVTFPIRATVDQSGKPRDDIGQRPEGEAQQDHARGGLLRMPCGKLPEILVAGQADAPAFGCAAQDLGVGRARRDLAHPRYLVAAIAQACDKRARYVLVAEQPQHHAAEGKTRSASSRRCA